jgi:hypothetical protein
VEYAAPDGAWRFSADGFYKDAAPMALKQNRRYGQFQRVPKDKIHWTNPFFRHTFGDITEVKWQLNFLIHF